jgi:hypothetical protein
MKGFLTFLTAVAAIVGIIVGGIAIKHALQRTPSFTASLANPGNAVNLVSFLKSHTNSKVAISLTCNTSNGVCSVGAGQGSQVIVTLHAGPNKSESAVLTFVPVTGGSGSLSSPGAGYYAASGDWTVQYLGSGVGAPNYQLTD